MPPFKDEHILVISPGSQTTLAQLGLPESLTPARLRIPTRMFQAEQAGEWEPIKVRQRSGATSRQEPGKIKDATDDVVMSDGSTAAKLEEEPQYEEDPSSDEGAVYPLIEGRVVNWPCFFALITHVYNTLSPPFHTPILVIAQSCWTAQDHETITQFFFEKFQTPAFCLMNSALATSYAYAAPTATVVDIGLAKCDITTITEHSVNELGRTPAIPGCGGEALTQRLISLLAARGFDREMCEQLKQSPICEVLPPGTDLPKEQSPEEVVSNPAAVLSTGINRPDDPSKPIAAASNGIPRGPGIDTEVGEADIDREVRDGEDEEGVLDVASIVASGKTSEFLARKEKEKAEKAAAKKNAADVAAAEKRARLPNSKRAKAMLVYRERRNSSRPDAKTSVQKQTTGELQSQAAAATTEVSDIGDGAELSVKTDDGGTETDTPAADGTAILRKEVEVGLERFQAADGGILERIADSIHRSISAVMEVNKRSELWNSIVIIGNGSKIRGFKEALLATLMSRYLISPNSATIFSSELPSNFTTPAATGTNTPQPQSHHAPHQASGVNPLLHAATTASLGAPAQQAQSQQLQQQYALAQQHAQANVHSSHAQTPTSIKTLKAPEYFPEWKEVGMEEASFLGAQIAAKVVFVVDQGFSKGFMSRTEYNELGPSGIHEICL